jgi:hypothetical protein
MGFDRVQNRHTGQSEAASVSHLTERHGLVTSYDSKNHLAKVTYQPSGEESTWLPIQTGHTGNGWGMLVGLTPGSGQGSGSGGAGGAGSGGQQYQGDHVTVSFQEGDTESGAITRQLHSDTDRPPKVESGEMLWMHSLGGRMFWKKDGSFHLYGKTSKQSSQTQQDQSSSSSAGASASGSGASGQGAPLKNAPPLQPQTYKMEINPQGVTTHSHFQQQQGSSGGGQDPSDPTSTQSPQAYSSMVTDPVNLKHTHTTYHKSQSGQSSGGGGQAQPDTTQGDPGMDPQSQQSAKMFSQTIHDTQKGQLQHTTFDTNGQMMHQVIMDNLQQTMTVQTFQNGQVKHSMVMDNQKGTITTKTHNGGQDMATIIMDSKGNIAHNAKGTVSINAPQLQSTGNWQHNGNFQGTNINATNSMSAPNGSVPGPTPGTPGVSFSGAPASPIAGAA